MNYEELKKLYEDGLISEEEYKKSLQVILDKYKSGTGTVQTEIDVKEMIQEARYHNDMVLDGMDDIINISDGLKELDKKDQETMSPEEYKSLKLRKRITFAIIGILALVAFIILLKELGIFKIMFGK